MIANADTRDKAASSDGDEEDEQDGNEKPLTAAVLEGERLPPKHCELNERSGNGHPEQRSEDNKAHCLTRRS